MKKLFSMHAFLLLSSTVILCISCEPADPPISISWASEYNHLAAGGNHSLVLDPNGTLWSWGSNLWGQLGDSTIEDKNRPVEIGPGFTSISAGQEYSLGLKADGSLWAWGRDYKKFPTQIDTGYSVIAAGDFHALALKTNGTLCSWGSNEFGQLGNGRFDDSPVPQDCLQSDFVAIAAGSVHSLALHSDGSLYAWGRNGSGQ